MDFTTVISAMIVKPVLQPIFSEMATTVRIDDEAAGCFVVIEQIGTERQSVRIDHEDWPLIRDAVDKMLLVCDQINQQGT